MSTPIKISKENAGKRLDVFLTEKFTKISRSQWQKRVKNELVLINGEKPAVHQFLKEGDRIEISNFQFPISNLKERKNLKYKIIFECPDYIIIEKPAGMLSQRMGENEGLGEILARDFPEIKKIGEEGRGGIAHRLDREASGVMLVARNKIFFDFISKQFEERQVKKFYLALTYGEIKKDEDVLDFPIGRSKQGRMAARAHDNPSSGRAPKDKGRDAITRIKVLKKFKNYTFLEAQIETGRTHQIRAHMLAYGYPIVGDKLYKFRSISRREKIKLPSGLSRLFLHSHRLGFHNLAGEWVEYESKLPKELKEVLNNL